MGIFDFHEQLGFYAQYHNNRVNQVIHMIFVRGKRNRRYRAGAGATVWLTRARRAGCGRGVGVGSPCLRAMGSRRRCPSSCGPVRLQGRIGCGVASSRQVLTQPVNCRPFD